MPGISFLKLFSIFGVVSTWADKALEDGKITLTEAAELAEELGPLLGIPVHIEADLGRRVSDLQAEPPETESLEPETVDEDPGGNRLRKS